MPVVALLSQQGQRRRPLLSDVQVPSPQAAVYPQSQWSRLRSSPPRRSPRVSPSSQTSKYHQRCDGNKAFINHHPGDSPSMFFSYRKSTRLRLLLAFMVFMRFAWNIYWLHSVWSPSAQTHTLVFVPTRPAPGSEQHQKHSSTRLSQIRSSNREAAVVATSDYSHYVPNWMHALAPELFADVGSGHDRVIEVVESAAVVQRRRNRQGRTTPPTSKLVSDQPPFGRPDLKQQYATTSRNGNLLAEATNVDIPLQQNWTTLCRKASFSPKSRVVISHALIQPLGPALGLLLARQCGVKEIAVIDPLYANSQLVRLAQLDRYQALVKAASTVYFVTPNSDPTIPDNLTIPSLVLLQPTHLIHLDSNLHDYKHVMEVRSERLYLYKRGMKALNDLLQVQRLMLENATTASSQPPRLVHVTSRQRSAEDIALHQLQRILARTYHEVFHVPVAQLELQSTYGPLVTTLESLRDQEASSESESTGVTSRMYMDEAIGGILQAFQESYIPTSFSLLRATTVADDVARNRNHEKAPSLSAANLFRSSETRAWEWSVRHDALGTSMSDAVYLETYGVPSDIFLCSSKCESKRCGSTSLDGIRNISREVTSDCDNVLYVADFSRSFDSDWFVESSEDDQQEEIDFVLCRVAFVSRKSRLVRRTLLSKEDFDNGNEAPMKRLRTENGKHVVMGWKLIWIIDFESDEDKDLSGALLRIDPSGMFHPRVAKAMYTEIYAFMIAATVQLQMTFEEMLRDGFDDYYRQVRRPGANVIQKILVPAEKPRKALFYARDSRSGPPKSMQEFLEKSETDISTKLIDFYQDSLDVVQANMLRNPSEGVSNLYKEFPFQWVSTGVFVHDLKLKEGQDFRCRWLREYLYWRGSRDTEILTFAYLFGKKRLQGLYGPRLGAEASERSWIPLMDPEDTEQRLRNAQDYELFMRLKEM